MIGALAIEGHLSITCFMQSHPGILSPTDGVRDNRCLNDAIILNMAMPWLYHQCFRDGGDVLCLESDKMALFSSKGRLVDAICATSLTRRRFGSPSVIYGSRARLGRKWGNPEQHMKRQQPRNYDFRIFRFNLLGPKAATAVKLRLLHLAIIERQQWHPQQPPNYNNSEPTAMK